MKEKNVALMILCVVVIIAIVGLVLMFSNTASARAYQTYPGGVMHQTTVKESPGMPMQSYRAPLEVEQSMPGYRTPYQTAYAK
ncbi:hypothetical protein KY333_01825 [Candidatus Woesearchaeota archaeon]|nr:hypothetical protein [Candidatus Woesearchaeota archaeon]MBW2993854.1 hypothetical protein [Candidatus Woesearchaeota archaeon]